MLKILFIEALSSVWSHKSRSVLTLLGVVIGIASVISVMAAGEGGKSIIMKEFEGLSPATLVIEINWRDRRDNRAWKPENLTWRDLEDIEKNTRYVESIAPVREMSTLIQVGDKQKNLSVTGTNRNYIEFVEYEMAEGRVFSDEEVLKQDKTAVIGWGIKEEFFPGVEAVGQYLRAFDTPFLVVGVLAEKENTGTVSLSDPDDTFNNAVVVPVTTFRRLFGKQDGFRYVLCKASDMKHIDKARREILSVLAANHGKWDDTVHKFNITGMKEQLDLINTVLNSITAGVAALAGIALLVAAIGIMNIMLVSVKERTREIGVMKALGARKSHIVGQFLMETLLLCGSGGLLGLLSAVFIAWLIGHLAGWPVIMSPFISFASLFLSLITGLVSGVYPAFQAARLMPHEALRYE